MKNINFFLALGLPFFINMNAIASSCDNGDHVHSSNEKIAKHIFEKADVDGDGFITLEEHTAASLSKFGTKFSVFDSDNDKRISIQEYMKTFKRFHPNSKEESST